MKRIYSIMGMYALATAFGIDANGNPVKMPIGNDPASLDIATARNYAAQGRIVLNDGSNTGRAPIGEAKAGPNELAPYRAEVGWSDSMNVITFSIRNAFSTALYALIGGPTGAENAVYSNLAAATNAEGTNSASVTIGGTFGTFTLSIFRQMCNQPLRVKGAVFQNYLNASSSTQGTAYTANMIVFLKVEINGIVTVGQYDISTTSTQFDQNQILKNLTKEQFSCFFSNLQSMVVRVPAAETVVMNLNVYSKADAANMVLTNSPRS